MSIYWLYLSLAIIAETVGTISLRFSNGFTNIPYAAATIVLYSISMYLCAKCLVKIPIGVTYAIWAGAGTAIVALIGMLIFKEDASWQKIAAISMIISGVIMLNLITEA